MNDQQERWVLLITPNKPHRHMVMVEAVVKTYLDSGWLLVGTWSKHSDVPKGNERVKVINRFLKGRKL